MLLEQLEHLVARRVDDHRALEPALAIAPHVGEDIVQLVGPHQVHRSRRAIAGARLPRAQPGIHQHPRDRGHLVPPPGRRLPPDDQMHIDPLTGGRFRHVARCQRMKPSLSSAA